MDRAWPGRDWKDAAAYSPLLDADRSLLAWEWLRRVPAYREDARIAVGGGGELLAERWGLHLFERPELSVPRARPIWMAACHPLVLSATAEPADDPADALDLSQLGELATLAGAPSGEHLLICDGLRCIRLDIERGTLGDGPVRLCHRLFGFAAAERPLLTLRRLIALRRNGAFAASLHPRDVRARRHILALRAHDAASSGASQREIAAVLLNAEAGAARWRVAAPSLRGQAQRLVRSARLMAAGGYRSLLA